MAVRHGVTDTDKHFLIDPVTRTIINESGKLVLIQYDHNSERFTFECPRHVDDHDMSLCNRIEIHYINTGTGNSRTTGVYEVRDLQVSPDDNNVVTCSWLISQNATQHVGKLNFVIRFACIAEDGTVEYAWNTGIYSDITISKSIYNGEEFIQDYVDVLETWKQDLYTLGLRISSVEQTVTSTEDNGLNVVTMTMVDGSTETFQIRNGSTGTSVESIEKISGDGSAGSTDIYSINMSNGTKHTFPVYNGADGKDAVSISSIERTSGDGSAGSIDTYTITMTDGSESTFPIYNGSDGKDAVSISSIERTSGDGSSGTIDTYTITMTDGSESTFPVYNGTDGRYISSVELTSGGHVAGAFDEYTIMLSDGTTSTFQVYNGRNGRDGRDGIDGKDGRYISSIDFVDSGGDHTSGTFDVYAITFSDGTTWQYRVLNGRDGIDGRDGPEGLPGVSIRSIHRTSGDGSSGTTDTYTITMSDGSISTFQVYNGADGEGAGDMLKSMYDPQNRNTDVFAYIDDKLGAIDTVLDSINGE